MRIFFGADVDVRLGLGAGLGVDLRVNGVESVLSSCYPRVFLYQCAFLNLGGAQKLRLS